MQKPDECGNRKPKVMLSAYIEFLKVFKFWGIFSGQQQ